MTLTSNLTAEINHLCQRLNQGKYEGVEAGNLLAEIRAFNQRLEHHQFRFTNFAGYNPLAFNRQNHEFLVNVDRWINQSATWRKILKTLSISSNVTVLDVGPGPVPKIELALIKLNFKGKVILCDLDPESQKSFNTFLELFKPISFELEYEPEDFLHQAASKPKVDFIVGNHVIDDLIFSLYLHEHPDQSLADIYNDETIYHEVINIVSASPTIMQKIILLLPDSIDNRLKGQGIVYLNLYQGALEVSMELNDWHQHCLYVMNEVEKNLIRQGYRHLPEAITEVNRIIDPQHVPNFHAMILKKNTE